MPHNLTILMTTLEVSRYLPPAWHRAAVRLAISAGSVDLLVKLSSRADAPADVLALCAKSSDETVQGALLGRDDGQGVTLLEGRVIETRATVLAAKLGPDARDYVVADALAAFALKPTLTLARKLITHPLRLDADQAYAILRRLDAAGCEAGVEGPALAGTIYRLGAARALALLTTASAPAVVAGLACFTVPLDLLEEAVVRVGATLSQAPAETAVFSLTSDLLRGIRLGRTVGAEELCQALTAAVSPAVLDACLCVPGGFYLPSLPVRPRTLHDEGAAAVAAQHRGSERPAEGPHGTDVAELEKIAARECELPSRGGWVLRVLLLNEATPQHVRRALAACVATSAERGWALPGLSDLNVSTLCHPDGTLDEAWCLAFPGKVLARDGWGAFGGPGAVHDVLRRTAVGPAANPAVVARRAAVIAAIARAGVPAALVPDLQVADIDAITAEPPTARATMPAAEAAFVASALGDQVEAWASYAALRSTFTGTLRELANVATTVAA